jgi:acetylornithine deacetylase/succinyl-diaminopimelate desuccinylase-like protein
MAAEAQQTLVQYVKLDTSNPPGDTTASATLLGQILEREGLTVQRYLSAPGKSILYARLPATVQPAVGKPILLLSHMDVVPADAPRWPQPPFAGRILDGELWGRGAIDMKGLGIVQLYAFLALFRQAGPRNRDVILMAVPDEESGGGLGTRWMIANHYPELDPEYVLDEGGCGSRDLYSPGKLVYGIAVSEKKLLWLRLRVTGQGGHGSQPHGQNPNDALVRALARLLATPAKDAAAPTVEALRQRLSPLSQNKFTNALQHSTIALTSLRSGVGEPAKPNVIPSVAEATLDCRILPGTTTAQWLTELRQQLADPQLTIEIIYESPDPVQSPIDTPLYRALDAAIHRYHPEAVVTPIPLPYGTDSNAFRPRGVKSYGLFPIILSTAQVSTMHGDGERLPLAGLGEAIQILFTALQKTLTEAADK